MDNSTIFILFLLFVIVSLSVALGLVLNYYRHKQCPPCGSSSIAEGTNLKPPSIAIQTPNWIFGMTANGNLYTAKIQTEENVQSIATMTETTLQGTKALFDDRGELILYDASGKIVWSSPSPLQTDLPVGDYVLTMDDATGNLNVLRSGVLVRTITLGTPLTKSASASPSTTTPKAAT